MFKVVHVCQVLSKLFFKPLESIQELIHLYRVFFLVGHNKMNRFVYAMNRITLIRFKKVLNLLNRFFYVHLPCVFECLIRINFLWYDSIFIWASMVRFKLLPMQSWTDSIFIWKTIWYQGIVWKLEFRKPRNSPISKELELVVVWLLRIED